MDFSPILFDTVVILTGITGAVGAPWVLDCLGIREPAVRGFAMGLVSHGIGTTSRCECTASRMISRDDHQRFSGAPRRSGTLPDAIGKTHRIGKSPI